MASKTKTRITGQYEAKNPNACLDLSDFDYTKLKREAFEEYNNFLESLIGELGLQQDQMFDFEVHISKPIFEERYPGIPNTPKDFIGITLHVNSVTGTSLKHSRTRIPIRMAKVLNQQITSEHSRIHGGDYYLLMKSENKK